MIQETQAKDGGSKEGREHANRGGVLEQATTLHCESLLLMPSPERHLTVSHLRDKELRALLNQSWFNSDEEEGRGLPEGLPDPRGKWAPSSPLLSA